MVNSLTLEDIFSARERINGGVLETPCLTSPSLSDIIGKELFCKSDFLQPTGSFKERGARNALLMLSEEAKRAGVVAASAGNHALALAYHGRDLDIPVTVVMPESAPLIKQTRCKEYGAKVLLSGSNIAESKILADSLAASEGFTYVHGFDGKDVIAGAGTLGLEILDQVPNVSCIVVPIGGGGLVAGLGLAVKSLKPEVKILGVETQGSASFSAAMEAGEPVRAQMTATLADGLAVPKVGDLSFSIARSRVDAMVVVDEEAVALAILRLIELEKGVVEGAGAACLAAAMQFPEKLAASGPNVLCLCGGNIDPMILGRTIEHGLTIDGRLAQFRSIISDRPGGLSKLCEVIAQTGASVKQIVHERAFARADVSRVEVDCTVETRDHAHIEQLIAALCKAGMPSSVLRDRR